MSHFLAVSAIREVSAEAAAAAIGAIVGRHGVKLDSPRTDASDDARDVRVFDAGSWTIILWPEYFNIHDLPMAEALSAELSTIVSTIHVYDDAYWTHGLFENGRLIDLFGSRPRYFDDEAEGEAVPIDATAWAGDPEAIARIVGVAPDAIARYLVHLDSAAAPTGRIYPDDAADIDDFWVFVDFWRRLGIEYPDMNRAVPRWQLSPGFDRRLPTADGL